MSVQSYGEGIPRAQKVNFSISQFFMFEYKSQQKSSPDDGFITHKYKLLSVPNKIPDLPNEKPYLTACAQQI
jgi:hypothetical protein